MSRNSVNNEKRRVLSMCVNGGGTCDDKYWGSMASWGRRINEEEGGLMAKNGSASAGMNDWTLTISWSDQW